MNMNMEIPHVQLSENQVQRLPENHVQKWENDSTLNN